VELPLATSSHLAVITFFPITVRCEVTWSGCCLKEIYVRSHLSNSNSVHVYYTCAPRSTSIAPLVVA